VAPTKFEIDGAEYEVSFRIGQQKAFQTAMGEPVVAALVSMETSPGDMIRLSALFRHALTPAVDEAAADEIIDKIGLGKTIQLISAASQEAFKDLADPQKAPPAK
jgi:hypothetical protein